MVNSARNPQPQLEGWLSAITDGKICPMARIIKPYAGGRQHDTKAEPFVQVNVYMSPGMRQRLRRTAAACGVSMSEYIKSVLTGHLLLAEDGEE